MCCIILLYTACSVHFKFHLVPRGNDVFPPGTRADTILHVCKSSGYIKKDHYKTSVITFASYALRINFPCATLPCLQNIVPPIISSNCI